MKNMHDMTKCLKPRKLVRSMAMVLTTLVASQLSTLTALAQTADDSGISAGFFDSSLEKDINFSTFKLPPLSVLFENAKSNPSILQLAKQQEIAQAEVAKQRKYPLTLISGHAGYSYGKTDVWSMGNSGIVPSLQQFSGQTQNYWNVGVNLTVKLEDFFDYGPSIRRKKLVVDDAQLKKDIAYDELKLQIATLYINITNNLIALKTAGENAAAYQGAEALNEVEFHHGNMEIENYARTGQLGQGAVNTYLGLLTTITTDIMRLEILTHTPIITNTTTEVTLDSQVEKTDKQIARENKEMEKKIEREAKADIKLEQEEQKAKQKEEEMAAKAKKEEEEQAEKAKKREDELARKAQKEEDRRADKARKAAEKAARNNK